MIRKIITVTAALAFSAAATQAASRDYISIVGSSTVYPFATVVAENFGKTTRYKTPKIESTGSGGGLKLFCAGVGVEHPDITNASRAIKKSEVETCAKNGVTDIIEVKIGYDGIVLANSKSASQMTLSRKDIFKALVFEQIDHLGHKGHMCSGKDRQSYCIDIFLEGSFGDHFRGLSETGVDHFHTSVS